MLRSIRWESDVNLAQSMARVQEKALYMDFYNPG